MLLLHSGVLLRIISITDKHVGPPILVKVIPLNARRFEFLILKIKTFSEQYDPEPSSGHVTSGDSWVTKGHFQIPTNIMIIPFDVSLHLQQGTVVLSGRAMFFVGLRSLFAPGRSTLPTNIT